MLQPFLIFAHLISALFFSGSDPTELMICPGWYGPGVEIEYFANHYRTEIAAKFVAVTLSQKGNCSASSAPKKGRGFGNGKRVAVAEGKGDKKRKKKAQKLEEETKSTLGERGLKEDVSDPEMKEAALAAMLEAESGMNETLFHDDFDHMADGKESSMVRGDAAI